MCAPSHRLIEHQFTKRLFDCQQKRTVRSYLCAGVLESLASSAHFPVFVTDKLHRRLRSRFWEYCIYQA